MKKTLLSSLLCFLCWASFAQVHIIRNKSLSNVVSILRSNYSIPLVTFSPEIDTAALAKEDAIRKMQGHPFRFGIPMKADIGLSKGKWKDTTGGRIWTLGIRSLTAKTINFQFDKFYLAPGSTLNMYNESGTMVMGPFTSKENNSQQQLGTDVFEGSGVIFHLFEPDSIRGTSKLHIFNVVHGYKGSFNGVGYGQSGSCEVNVACSQGSNWQTESNAVADIITGSGNQLCSGSIITDVCKDFRSFLLTAFHCVDLDENGTLSSSELSNVNYWVLRFKYKSPTCTNSNPTNYISYNGAQLRSGWQASDFALVEMYSVPSATDNISYAGWTRSTTPMTSGVMIHHPSGDVMKISTVTSAATLYTWPGYPSNTHWNVTFSSGSNEPGSSGSPLFDQNHHIVGQNHGYALNNCPIGSGYTNQCFCSQPYGEFGRFDLSWTGGGTSSTRLKDWLDPNNTNTMSMNEIVTPAITTVSSTCTSAVYQIASTAGPVTWTVGSGLSISGPNNNYSVTINGTTSGNLTASFTNCGSISQYITIGKQPLTVNASVDRTPQPGGYQYLTATVTQLAGTVPGNYSWYTDVNGTPTTLLATGLTLNHYPLAPCSGTIYYDCVANETCGQVIYTTYAYNTNGCGNAVETNDYKAYPNPSNTTLSVTKNVQTSSNDALDNTIVSPKFRIELYNSKGMIMKLESNHDTSRTAQVSTSDLAAGTYYLHIIEGKKIYKQQIIVTH